MKTKQEWMEHYAPLDCSGIIPIVERPRLNTSIIEAIQQDALKDCEAENIRRIKHLNRLASWAQQDPTGPWEKLEIQKWVLNEIRGALGQEPLPMDWQPPMFDFDAKILQARQSAYDECAEIIDKRAACMTVPDEFIDRLRDAIFAAKKELK